MKRPARLNGDAFPIYCGDGRGSLKDPSLADFVSINLVFPQLEVVRHSFEVIPIGQHFADFQSVPTKLTSKNTLGTRKHADGQSSRQQCNKCMLSKQDNATDNHCDPDGQGNQRTHGLTIEKSSDGSLPRHG